MGLHMLGQMIRPHEPLAADITGEPLLSRVRPQMPLQLVGPGESLPAEQPVAEEWSLSRVPPQVGLKVRRFPVHLVAAGIVADVHLLRRGLSQAVLLVYAVRALALDASPGLGGVAGEVAHRYLGPHRLHGAKGGHVAGLGPLVLLLRNDRVLRLVAAGREVSWRR